MARWSWSAAILAAVTVLAGCGGALGGGSAPGQGVSCAFFQADNCWSRFAATATACTDSTTGTFDAGTNTCTYADGVTIDFATPASQSAADNGPPWHFTVKAAGGASCATVVETGSTLTVTTAAGTAGTSISGSNLVLTCPDGSQYHIDELDALACILDVPGPGWSTSGPMISYSLLGAPVGERSLWVCSR